MLVQTQVIVHLRILLLTQFKLKKAQHVGFKREQWLYKQIAISVSLLVLF